jgi:hypothetical protein
VTPEALPEAVIAEARVAPGHDGDAELVVWVRYGNGGLDSVTLDAAAAERLLARCRVQDLDGLRGQPWRQLMHVLDAAQGADIMIEGGDG